MRAFALTLALCSVLLLACASLADSHAALTWQDLRGDRGGTVVQRDLAWCVEAVETRRSLLQTCMQERGWVSNP